MLPTITATEAKQNFGEVIHKTLLSPICVEKNGKRIAVVMSLQEFERLQALEDGCWLFMAQRSLAEGGGLEEEESDRFLTEILNATN